MANSEPGQNDQLRKYLIEGQVLFILSSRSAHSQFKKILLLLGVSPGKIVSVFSVVEARNEMKRVRPRLVFSEFVDLDLLADSESEKPIFILVTKKASQSQAAQAVEAGFDHFVIIPYHQKAVVKAVFEAIQKRIRPDAYLEWIEEGKTHLAHQRYDEAIEKFTAAMKERKDPALACFYSAQAELMKLRPEEAQFQFEKGLTYNPIHYPCLKGLSHLFQTQKKFKQAYDVTQQLVRYYPSHEGRLLAALRMAVINDQYQDVTYFYQIFRMIEEPSQELIKSMSSALLVSGKFYLRKNEMTRAVGFFDLGTAVAVRTGKTNFILYAIEALVDFDQRSEALRFLEKLFVLDRSGTDYRVANFYCSTFQESLIDSIEKGKALLNEGIEIPKLHEKMIEQWRKVGNPEMARQLVDFAVRRWPEKKDHFLIAGRLENAMLTR